MLQQILTHTPIWVWIILGVLFIRGMKMAQDRETTVRSLVLMPLVMLGWSLSGLLMHAEESPVPLLLWFAAAVLSVWLAQTRAKAGSMRVLGEGRVWVRGSWMPLTVMMVIFCVQYFKNVLLVMSPELQSMLAFSGSLALISGLLNGLLLSRMLTLFRTVQASEQAFSANLS